MAATIVVGVDGSASSLAALAWAGDQARLLDAAVQVVIAYRYPLAYAGTQADPSIAAPEAQAHATQVLERAIAATADDLDGVRVSTTIIPGESPGHALVEAAAEAQLLVVGAHGEGGVSGFTLGSVSHFCVGHASCPVVVVPVR
jgi:nucleotide-binding universal stress UspA family protein